MHLDTGRPWCARRHAGALAVSVPRPRQNGGMANLFFAESSRHAATSGHVQARGAREHNLKEVDVDIPRNALVVFSGVSGSGKSSLAFGTIYAEAQRRYFESVAPCARRLIDQAGVPDVDAIDGLPPAVALQQQRGASNARRPASADTSANMRPEGLRRRPTATHRPTRLALRRLSLRARR